MMPRNITLELENDLKIKELYKPFGFKVETLLNRANKKWVVGIFCGYRTFTQQEELYKRGRDGDTRPIVTNTPPGFSYHNYSLAADLVFKTPDWNWSEKNPWTELGEMGRTLGLEWGGDFRGFSDRPHFQFPIKVALLDLKKIHDECGLTGVWDYLDENT